jgi:hypothetical protein
MNNLMARWVGKSARARAVGICMAGFHVGSMAGLLAAPPLMGTKWGVGGPFYLFGVLGFAWLATWLALVPDSTPLLRKVQKPSEDKVGGNRVAGEITLIEKLDLERKAGNGGHVEAGHSVEAMSGQKVGGSRQIPASKLPPFGLLLSKAPTWAIIVANSVNNWVSASGQLGIALCLPLLLRPSCGSSVILSLALIGASLTSVSKRRLAQILDPAVRLKASVFRKELFLRFSNRALVRELVRSGHKRPLTDQPFYISERMKPHKGRHGFLSKRLYRHIVHVKAWV